MQYHGVKKYAGNFPINILNLYTPTNQFPSDALPDQINSVLTLILEDFNARHKNTDSPITNAKGTNEISK